MNNKKLENIALQWLKISNKELTEFYNNGKIVNLDDIKDINILKQSKDRIFVMMDKKVKNPSKIDLLIEEFREFKKEMIAFKTDVTARLDNIVTKNNLLE